MAKRSTMSGEPFDFEKDFTTDQEPETEPVAAPVAAPVPKAKVEVALPRDVILRSKAFMKYQRDFAKVLLPNATYTVSEARKILEAYFGKDGE